MDYQNKNYYYNSNAYIDGNTVRRREAAPQWEQPAPKPEKSVEQIIRERNRRKAAKRNQQRAMAMNRGQAAFLIGATVICCAVCGAFVNVQANISSHMATIASLEAQVSEQKTANAETEKRLQTSVTLDTVKAKAEEMGMVYPESEQIQYYTAESNDYMNQYSDIASR